MFQSEASDVGENDDYDDAVAEDEIKDKKKNGIYKPPKLAAVPYGTSITLKYFILFVKTFFSSLGANLHRFFQIAVDSDKEEKQRKLLENAKKRALNSSVMQELKEECLETPLEISTANITLRNTQSKYRKEKER